MDRSDMGQAMTEAAAAAPQSTPQSTWTLNYPRLLNALFWITAFSGSVVFIEPSPYDGLILLTLIVWVLGGVRIHRAVLPGVALLVLWALGGYISLIPYWNEPDPVEFMTHTLFISTTGVFYMLFFSENTSKRFDLCMSGYAASCMLAALIAVGSWAGLFGNPETMTLDGRAMAPFKDPNVLGSYMVPGVLYFVQRLLLGRWRYWPVTLAGLALSGAALFTSFSRGSWGAAVVSITLMTIMSVMTADSRKMRIRIGFMALAVVGVVVVGIGAALTDSSVREFFYKRASATQDYDEGPTGRFGNQKRSLPMLVERPNGMGPLRFRLIFGLEPHNSYINAFASNGWLGGFAFLGLVLTTTFVGFRLSLTRSPYLRHGQLIWSAMFVFFLQALQIDIDHWRYFFIYLGAVWGLEVGRVKWAERAASTARSEARP
ncbi:O-antigen ligase family protein [Methylocapsa aurea]|uniref:O-antigen ligase family protein n=1 Tax=Methylocapsa aurea TaxID=663610 RepID=UPI003D18C48F